MTANTPPANISQLLAKVSATTARIQAHRDAMAAVAAQAKATPAPGEGVNGK